MRNECTDGEKLNKNTWRKIKLKYRDKVWTNLVSLYSKDPHRDPTITSYCIGVKAMPQVPDQGCAGPVAYIIRGAPSPRTCNICHFKGCKRTGGGKKIHLVGMKEGIGWQF